MKHTQGKASCPGHRYSSYPRARAQVTWFFDGLELAEPGVTDVSEWHPKIPPARPQGQAPPRTYTYGGIAKKQ
jgi:hypothetical protein